ncbi:MAG: RecQ family ATP-dependent DNA helicase [Caldilineaceae bacterium SB0661_bin_34]|nr:RecQ family ATP-dependent DNA helicase [Caldilineaceae bacterium SB0661_bin_34]
MVAASSTIPAVIPTPLGSFVAIDLEVHGNRQLTDIGAVRHDGQTFRRKLTNARQTSTALKELDRFCKDCNYLLGHNLIDHDLTVLRQTDPDLHLLHIRVIDTLYLSPLANPEHPYHPLVKNYKLVKDTVNDPVADARLATRLFSEQYDSFRRQAYTAPDLIRFYAYCFRRATNTDGAKPFQGLADMFDTVVQPLIASEEEAQTVAIGLGDAHACPNLLRRLVRESIANRESLPAWAYCVAWLRVAGSNSVLPEWVRHQHVGIPSMLRKLRELSCRQDSCVYCRRNHDAVAQLRRFFQFEDFRLTEDGQPLQRTLSEAGMNGTSLLGVLPTSGGKSLCFQLPALVRYFRRGLLTVVVSPLQALMKDQVDNLRERTGVTTEVAAVFGLLTPPERGAVLEQVRMGDIGLLYLAPEQLRNPTVVEELSHREIGCWVFDEAHCLSKWGPDFRPDYLYVSRFIKEQSSRNQDFPPAIACYTATAKQDVIEDIRQHFNSALDRTLSLYTASVERANLGFEVRFVPKAIKWATAAEVLDEQLPDNGSCIVYCSTRKSSEDTAHFLALKGFEAAHFHGGLDPARKKEVLEDFIDDRLKVICATNAFGMGVDKENVRLVLHVEVPGSLENYLQEAGRAGRDGRPATCILLFDEQDIETQFRLGNMSRISQRDIQQVLRGIRRRERGTGKDIVVTTGELLRSDDIDTSFDITDSAADTKVKTAVAWLERGGFLNRNHNSNQVFNGKPLFATLEEAKSKLDSLQLKPSARRNWELLLQVLINSDIDDGLNADFLAHRMGGLAGEQEARRIGSQEVIRILNQMAQVGIVSDGLLMTTFLRPKGSKAALREFEAVCRVENMMVALLEEEQSDADLRTAYPLDLKRLNQRLINQGTERTNPSLLRNLLKSIATDGRGMAGQKGSIEFKFSRKDHYLITLNRDWPNLKATVKKRHDLAGRILGELYARLPKEHASSQAEVLVQFSLKEVQEGCVGLVKDPDNPLPSIERGLLFLHEQNVIILQHGLAMFRQAMTMNLKDEARERRYNQGDYARLDSHYKAKVNQVHVVNEYAQLSQESMEAAGGLVADYFQLDNITFNRRYFRGRRDLLDLATSQQSFGNIVESLGNPHQQAIVQAPADGNMLVLAGPGSGKTKVVVHRCAYLTRVERVPPFSILVLCFNHSTAVELRRRLKGLLGDDARSITVQTYHGLALRLVGHTALTEDYTANRRHSIDFDKKFFDEMIAQAAALLMGQSDIPGIPDDQLRERLLAGFRYILVDEYQDIDQGQYELISAIAGRTLKESDDKLSIMAVGDDDQSIYEFRKANVRFIRQFEEDYCAQRHYLVQNYRSTDHIIAAANQLIARNRDRMKTKYEIRVNDARRSHHPGGMLANVDRGLRGRVQIVDCQDTVAQALAAVAELKRLKGLLPDLAWDDCAVLARHGLTGNELDHFRSAANHAGIPLSLPLGRDETVSPFRIREFDYAFKHLHQVRTELFTHADLDQHLARLNLKDGPRMVQLKEIQEHWKLETGGSEFPVQTFTSYMADCLLEIRREQRVGDGVFTGTAHSVKGLEFRVVLVLDGHWKLQGQDQLEEERRLFYVAMTRAMDSLVLFRCQGADNPHLKHLTGEACFFREGPNSGSYPLTGHAILGLQDFYLSYAGRKEENHHIHAALRELHAGDTVVLETSTGRLNHNGTTVAVLSRRGRDKVNQIAGSAVEGTVLAMVRRSVEEENEEYRASNRTASWEVPMVELSWEQGIARIHV